ncbi:MAG: two-component system, chemotaxis family, chemotaxis protein CheY [Pseudomonadota bacterium]|nr:two-component system, chemotaxis family, chemotaxis protein CheY [Pseudomonadota bacterium]MDQ5917725.1 two-component system, chemotaxis family, chemotaxis protein CheY [Pseudomonadota bacterium]
MYASFQDLDILLVEPSAVQARIIRDFFAGLEVTRVDHVGSGAEALARMCERSPALTVSALYLPDMTGIELIEAMRDDDALATLPFVLISSETRPQVLDPVRQSGACAILPKPFTADQLAVALRSALDFLNPSAMLEVDADLEQLRVLLVDDSANARRFVRHVLGNLGIEEFVEAANGVEALEILSDTMVDLVITDYNMPEMDGRALIEHIRQQSWQSSVPILMVTSESNMSRLAAVEQAGVSAICDKPFEPKMIKRLIEQAIAGRER